MSKHVSKENGPSSLQHEPALSQKKRIQNLIDEMYTCINAKRPIDFSIPPHIEITEALRTLVYEEGDPAKLQVIYGDSTRGADFPVRTLWLPKELPWDPMQVFAVGTLTFRHVDYDDYVDRYLIRDRETRTMSNREIEERAYERMTEVLEDSCLKNQSFLEIYHTGLEPLIVGLYRAVVEHLQTRRRSGLAPMTIQPIFFIKKGERVKGKLWG